MQRTASHFTKTLFSRSTRTRLRQKKENNKTATLSYSTGPAAEAEAPLKKRGGFGKYAMFAGLVGGAVLATYFDFRPYVNMMEKRFDVKLLPTQQSKVALIVEAPIAVPVPVPDTREIDLLNAQLQEIQQQLASEKTTIQNLKQELHAMEETYGQHEQSHTLKLAQLEAELSAKLLKIQEMENMEPKIIEIQLPPERDEEEVRHLQQLLQQERKDHESTYGNLKQKEKDFARTMSKLIDVEHAYLEQFKQLKEEHEALTESKLSEIKQKNAAELKTKMDEITSEYQALMEEEKKQSEELSKQLLDEQSHRLNIQYAEENQTRIARLKALTNKVYALQIAYQSNMEFLEDSYKLSRVTMGILAFNQALSTGIPFKPEVEVLEALGKGDETIETILKTIPAHLQMEGVKKVSDLLVDFQRISYDAHAASFAVHEGLLGWLYSKVAYSVTFRETGFVEGDNVNAKLARAEVYLKNDKLLSAVKELEGITGEAGKCLQPWLATAHERLLADQATAILDAHLSNLKYTILQ